MLFILPLFKALPDFSTYPILGVVGIFMFSEVKNINFNDFANTTATFLIFITIPLTFSITQGLALGFLSFVLVKIFQRDFKNLGLYVIAIASGLALIFH